MTQDTNTASGAAEIATRLRNACASVRTKSYPLADLIPLMQQAADALASAASQPVAPAHTRALENVALLADILNRRPAMNAGLTEAYANWTNEVYNLMGTMAREPANGAALAPAPAQQPTPSAAAVGKWSLGEIDGNWRDIDLPDHGAVMRIIWRMEDDTGRNEKLEAQAHAVIAALNAPKPSPTPQADSQPAPALGDEDEALDLLAILFDAWENGTPCYEEPESSDGFLGQAFRIDDNVFHRCVGILNRRRSNQGAARAPADSVTAPVGQPYGIVDPDYARVFTQARIIAWQYGYACVMHGSFTRDLDLLLVPWTEQAGDNHDQLLKLIAGSCGLRFLDGKEEVYESTVDFTEKPHGRKSCSLFFREFGDRRWIDISIVPRPLYATPPAQAADSVLEDAERLDWLALAGPTSICVVVDRRHDGEVEVATDDVTGYGKTLREALDASRKQGATP